VVVAAVIVILLVLVLTEGEGDRVMTMLQGMVDGVVVVEQHSPSHRRM
jgi:hypothetical protein